MYDEANIANILKEWGKQGTPEQLDELTRWRDQRLAALAAHKHGQPRRHARPVARSIDLARPSGQIELRHSACAFGDHLAAPHHKQPARFQPYRLDRIGGLEHHEIAVAADIEPIALETHDPRGVGGDRLKQ